MSNQLNRQCPKCGKKMVYTTVSHYNYAVRNNQSCIACHAARLKTGGSSNPFFGRKHSSATKTILSKVDKRYTKTRRFSKAVKAGMAGMCCGGDVNLVWLKKYGKDGALERRIATNKKLSRAFSGDKNPMYGKPPPSGSGNGWKGWFKGVFFRSIRELMFLVDMQGRRVETAETRRFSIRYTDPLGNDRNYFPDFFVDGKFLYEIKPRKLWSSPSVESKRVAAMRFCLARGLEYLLVDPEVRPDIISNLMTSGDVKWMKRYEKLVKHWLAVHALRGNIGS